MVHMFPRFFLPTHCMFVDIPVRDAGLSHAAAWLFTSQQQELAEKFSHTVQLLNGLAVYHMLAGKYDEAEKLLKVRQLFLYLQPRASTRNFAASFCAWSVNASMGLASDCLGACKSELQ